MKHFNTTSRTVLWLMVLLSSLSTFAQSPMIGDGFGGRAGYCPTNYADGASAMSAVCGVNNQLYVWGYNSYAQLGVATPTTGSTTPVAVPGMTNVIQYSISEYSAAIKSDGTAWVWGKHSNVSTYVPPAQVLTNAYYCASGTAGSGISNAYFVKKDGTVWTVGYYNNYYGNPGAAKCVGPNTNCAVQMLGITTAKRIATTDYYVYVLLADGSVMIVESGQVAVAVPGLSNIVAMAGTATTMYFLTNTGQVYKRNQLSSPVLVTFPSGAAPIKAITANNDVEFIMALDDNGNMYNWGGTQYGVLGNGTSSSGLVASPELRATNVRDIIAGNHYTAYVKNDGTLWATGDLSSVGLNLAGPTAYTTSYKQLTPTVAPYNLCAPSATCFTGMPPCVAGTTAPAVTPTTATNSCPATTVDLTSLAISSTTPSGAKLIWSTRKTPTSAGDTLTTAQKTAVSAAGKYYALYYDAANACYSPADSVTITLTTCTTPIALTNTCPTATVNLTTAVSATNLPSGATVTWHTGTPATTANKVADPTAVSTSGTYYLAFFDGTNNCYSDVSQDVTVTITSCGTPFSVSNPAAQTATTGTAKTGNAATELNPTGGTAPYVYSNGAGDAACVAPSGATLLTGLTVNSNGSYSYTAPTTAGTYYYCIKVCDSATPMASCVVKTYTLTVTAAATCTVTGVVPSFIKN